MGMVIFIIVAVLLLILAIIFGDDGYYGKSLFETLMENKKEKNDNMYQCFHCGANAVSWGSDFDFEDYCFAMENDNGEVTDKGKVHVLHCNNCGADIEYYVPIFEEDIKEIKENVGNN